MLQELRFHCSWTGYRWQSLSSVGSCTDFLCIYIQSHFYVVFFKNGFLQPVNLCKQNYCLFPIPPSPLKWQVQFSVTCFLLSKLRVMDSPVHEFFIAVLMGKREEIIVWVGWGIYLCVFFISASLEIETLICCLRSCFKMYSATKSNAHHFCTKWCYSGINIRSLKMIVLCIMAYIGGDGSWNIYGWKI